MNKPLEWISRSRVRLVSGRPVPASTHLDQLSASHHHLCSSCYHVDLHSSSLLRIDAHCDVVVSPHTDTHHSIVLLPVSSPTHVFCMRCVLPCSLRFAHCVLPATSYKAPSPRLLLHSYMVGQQILYLLVGQYAVQRRSGLFCQIQCLCSYLHSHCQQDL